MHGKILLWAVVLTLVIVTGCGNGHQENNKLQTYSNDGYMGISSANPNMPTSPGYHSYGKDVRMMDQALRRIEGIRSSSITFNGPHVGVHLVLEPGIRAAQKEQIRQQAWQILTKEMPRYHIEVDSE